MTSRRTERPWRWRGEMFNSELIESSIAASSKEWVGVEADTAMVRTAGL
jgi:hypothetical protein